MESAFIALVGVLVGILCNEHFRRKNRIEAYSLKLFEKRLTVHEELFSLFQNAYSIVSEMIENESLSQEERHDIASGVIMPLCEFLDENEFYLDNYLTVQVSTAYIGSEDIGDIEDETEREAAKSKIRQDYMSTKKMIIAESGAAEAFKHFKSVSKSSPDSAVIRYMKELDKNKV
ncbi:hypothetical protein AYI82_20390 [Shewanella algae]|uniref:hypothetical protein n=1 Tax=Shewanella algae TaxID=38313 RepID=UPI001183183D|nr:hypothetical protein [Shewanella algae]TVL02876.1 hypothetical protein AYI82_20390 [Shewanella algae]